MMALRLRRWSNITLAQYFVFVELLPGNAKIQTVSAYFPSKQILSFDFTDQNGFLELISNTLLDKASKSPGHSVSQWPTTDRIR